MKSQPAGQESSASSGSSVAIACATGGFKGAFVSGVLDAFEAAGFRADAYAAASSSVMPAAAAAVGQSARLGLDHWLQGQQLMADGHTNMSAMILDGIAKNHEWLVKRLFAAEATRFVVAASAVSEGAAEETQGKGARRRGRLLLLAAARGDRRWIEDNLALELFDTASAEKRLRLTADNFDQVAYASTRMLHAWDIPAWVDGRPYVDAYYTRACAAAEMAELGFESVIAIGTEPSLYRDIFQDQIIPESWQGRTIYQVRPAFDPSDRDVHYTTASEEGLAAVYEHGRKQAGEFLSDFSGPASQPVGSP